MGYHRSLPMISNRTGLIVMAAIFSALDIIVVAGRFLARSFIGESFRADDWTSLASLIMVLNLNGSFIAGVVEGPIGGHSPVHDDWPITTPLMIVSQKYKWYFQSWEKPTFALIKISILLLWLRFFYVIRRFRIACWIMIGVCAAWGVAFTGATVFQCGVHWDWNWSDIDWFLTRCSNTLNMLTVFCATDVVTDLIIIIMPVPVIWHLALPLRKRIGVAAIFTMGFFTVGAGIARMYIYLVTSYDKENNPDYLGDFTLFMLWSDIELNIAMIVSCMPTLTPLLARIRDSFSALSRIPFFKTQQDILPTHKTYGTGNETGFGRRSDFQELSEDSCIRVDRMYEVHNSSRPGSGRMPSFCPQDGERYSASWNIVQ